MATFRFLDEFGLSDTILILETGLKCAAHCPYCHVALSRRVRRGGDSRRYEDPGTFESTVEHAFGPDYDPTNFLHWGLRHRLPICWAAGTEPFQDVAQARAVLSIAERLGLPFYWQTKGLNWRDVFDRLEPLAGNAVLMVSFPTDDDRALKRFEPGTPRSAERLAFIDAALAAGLAVDVAMAPYHPDWCADLPGFARRLAAKGIREIFLDPLFLSPKQRAVCHDPVTVELSKTSWSDRFVEQGWGVREACREAGIGFSMQDPRGVTRWLRDVPNPDPFPYRPGSRRWPYIDKAFMPALEAAMDEDPPGPPTLVRFADAFAAMEANGPGPVEQPFSFGSLGLNMYRFKRQTPPSWLAKLKPLGTIRDYFRAIWNTPSGSSWAWRHPFARVALRPGPGKVPWTDDAGDLMMIFDPWCYDRSLFRVVDDLGACRAFEPVGTGVGG